MLLCYFPLCLLYRPVHDKPSSFRAFSLLHYTILFFSAVVINEAASALGPRLINFCHSDDYTMYLYYSSSSPIVLAPSFWEPPDQPQPEFFLVARERTLGTRLCLTILKCILTSQLDDVNRGHPRDL